MIPTTFTLTLTPQDVEIIGKALGEMPYKFVGPLIAKLDVQLAEQQKPSDLFPAPPSQE